MVKTKTKITKRKTAASATASRLFGGDQSDFQVLEKIDFIDVRLDKIDVRFDGIDGRLDKIEASLEDIKPKLPI